MAQAVGLECFDVFDAVQHAALDLHEDRTDAVAGDKFVPCGSGVGGNLRLCKGGFADGRDLRTTTGKCCCGAFGIFSLIRGAVGNGLFLGKWLVLAFVLGPIIIAKLHALKVGQVIRADGRGPLDDPEGLGRSVAARLLEQGAGAFLA